MGQLSFQKKVQRQFSGESIVCSTNGAGTTGYPHVKLKISSMSYNIFFKIAHNGS